MKLLTVDKAMRTIQTQTVTNDGEFFQINWRRNFVELGCLTCVLNVTWAEEESSGHKSMETIFPPTNIVLYQFIANTTTTELLNRNRKYIMFSYCLTFTSISFPEIQHFMFTFVGNLIFIFFLLPFASNKSQS